MGLNQIDVSRDLIDFSFILNSDVESDKVEFTLMLTEWEESQLKIQINFTDPLIISKGISPDQVLCRVKRRDLFVSKLTGEPLDIESKYFSDRLPV